MSDSRPVQVMRLLAQEYPYAIDARMQRTVRRICNVIPDQRKKYRWTNRRLIAALAALPYRWASHKQKAA